MGIAITERLDALFAPYNRSDEPGCTVAVARDGRPIYRRGFGLADLAQGVANQPSTPMPVGSIAKQFTCAALLLLQVEGALALEDPVGRWLPELPCAQSAPTLRQLMRHQSGVRCYLDQWMFNGYRTLPAGLPWAIQLRQKALNFEPGSRSAYSNGGYLLLSKVIERASGMPFAAFVEQRLLGPSGMRASGFPGRQASTITGLATPTMRDGNGWTQAPSMTEEAFGDGGFVASADDLLRWAAYLRTSGGPIGIDTLAAHEEPWAPGPSDYRYGLIFQRWRGAQLAQHTGGLPGANSAFLMLPNHGVDIVVLFNRAGPATSLAMRVAEVVAADALEPASPPPSASDHAACIGRYYESDDGFLFGLHDTEGSLSLSLFGDRPFPLEPCPSESGEFPFWADAGAAQIRFRPGARAGAIDYFDGTAWASADRLPPSPVRTEDVAAEATGLFHSPDAAATIRLEARGEKLLVHVQGEIGNGSYDGEVVAPDLIRFWPPLFPTGKLARLIREAGEVRGVLVSTPRTRGILFNRVPLPDRRSPS